ncbi:hypothetical protein DMUE_1595 [Dictyocoela muelleri]|nr:hypothetical protein DMUE_1595 [Dictyocoela muelleri]
MYNHELSYKIFETINNIIIVNKLEINDVMDYISITEYVFSFISNIPRQTTENDISFLYNKYEFIQILESEIIIKDIMNTFNELIVQINSLYSENERLSRFKYLFKRKYSALYHYFKHKNFKGRVISLNEYFKKINNWINLVFKTFSYNNDMNLFLKYPFGSKNCHIGNIKYISKKNGDVLRLVFSITVKKNNENTNMLLVIEIDKYGVISVVTFFIR